MSRGLSPYPQASRPPSRGKRIGIVVGDEVGPQELRARQPPATLREQVLPQSTIGVRQSGDARLEWDYKGNAEASRPMDWPERREVCGCPLRRRASMPVLRHMAPSRSGVIHLQTTPAEEDPYSIAARKLRRPAGLPLEMAWAGAEKHMARLARNARRSIAPTKPLSSAMASAPGTNG